MSSGSGIFLGAPFCRVFNQRVSFFYFLFLLFFFFNGVTHHCTITDCWVEFEGVFLNIMGVSRHFFVKCFALFDTTLCFF
jgi:hypothetical protein